LALHYPHCWQQAVHAGRRPPRADTKSQSSLCTATLPATTPTATIDGHLKIASGTVPAAAKILVLRHLVTLAIFRPNYAISSAHVQRRTPAATAQRGRRGRRRQHPAPGLIVRRRLGFSPGPGRVRPVGDRYEPSLYPGGSHGKPTADHRLYSSTS